MFRSPETMKLSLDIPSLRAQGCTRRRRNGRGFTLIELMITVAIVAILAAVAYPSYVNYIRKSKRATAQAALMDIAAKEQAYLLDRRKYTNALGDLVFVTPQEIANAYDITVSTPTDMTFTATATPKNAQNTQGEKTLTLDQSGARTPPDTGYWGK